MQASDEQVQRVRKLRKDGMSLRGISKATALGLSTVRTIIDQGTAKERTRTGELRREHYDKAGAARFMSQKRGHDELPKRINAALDACAALDKAAKGLGKK